MNDVDRLSIVVVGASGDLARRKIYPALFALYCQDLLPVDFKIYGFARSAYSHAAFRERITEKLTCRYAPGQSCAGRMTEFLSRCFYQPGQYKEAGSFLDLYQLMQETGGAEGHPVLFYMATPPSVFLDVAQAIGNAGLVQCDPHRPWSRIVIEKPFGRDRASSDLLTRELAGVFTESQTYRIDHYLGKELIQNLMVLRFANLIFEPVWNRDFVEQVTISWEEDIGVEGRGGYFDNYGIIRDVIQNHLLQILALVAMERPRDLTARSIRNAKVNAVRQIPEVVPADIVIGQYTAGDSSGKHMPGYTDDESVPADSSTPTFAAVNLSVKNERWAGVPFVIRAGKGLAGKMTEIRMRFREVPSNIFCRMGECPEANELIIRVQPDEAIMFRIVNKEPGLTMKLSSTQLDLQYEAAYDDNIPDAYESLLLDVMRGEKSLFIRSDELEAAWDVFTPALHAIDAGEIRPLPYAFGSCGPESAETLGLTCGAQSTETKRRASMEQTVCNGDHTGHLCVLVSEKKFDEIKGLVQDPKFICFNCGRVADSDKNLCNPMPLND